jgi:hypothetical protein
MAGRLEVRLVNGFVPQADDTFNVITCSSESGAFGSVGGMGPPGLTWVPRYSSTNVILSLTSAVSLSPPQVKNGQLTFRFISAAGVLYAIQRTTSLSPPNWQTIDTIPGDGTVKSFTDSANEGESYYRIAYQQ